MPTNEPTPVPSLLSDALQGDRDFVESVAIPERIWGGNKDRTTVRLCRIAEEGLDAQEELLRVARALKPLRQRFDELSLEWNGDENVDTHDTVSGLFGALNAAFDEIGDIDGLAE